MAMGGKYSNKKGNLYMYTVFLLLLHAVYSFFFQNVSKCLDRLIRRT